ncbi:MAG: histidine phosphatase family protein [Clostridium sp.]|nr:histidine phosphatase family protein [Clostridium sp.]MCM1208302.1 histidine phosphatase family protein [Ruminococcus sp.]
MTTIYFVRHAQPDYQWVDDRTRPLTNEGKQDAEIVLDFLRDKEIDVFYSSPYKRSYDTIAATAAFYGKEIITDERLRERKSGDGGNMFANGLLKKRWENHDFHEKDGESINMVQKRNMEALGDILAANADKRIVIGTHGTALSSILNFYNAEFGVKDFLRIVDWMPYVIELIFEGNKLLSIEEHCHIAKEYTEKR